MSRLCWRQSRAPGQAKQLSYRLFTRPKFTTERNKLLAGLASSDTDVVTSGRHLLAGPDESVSGGISFYLFASMRQGAEQARLGWSVTRAAGVQVQQVAHPLRLPFHLALDLPGGLTWPGR